MIQSLDVVILSHSIIKLITINLTQLYNIVTLPLYYYNITNFPRLNSLRIEQYSNSPCFYLIVIIRYLLPLSETRTACQKPTII